MPHTSADIVPGCRVNWRATGIPGMTPTMPLAVLVAKVITEIVATPTMLFAVPVGDAHCNGVGHGGNVYRCCGYAYIYI